MTVIV